MFMNVHSSSKDILAYLNTEDATILSDIIKRSERIEALQKELNNEQMVLSLSYNYFWGRLMAGKHERCETLGSRSKALTIGRTEKGELVLLEVST